MAGGALLLFVSTFVVQIIGLLYKIPLTNIYGTAGRAYFSTAYAFYVPLYAISMGGLPVAVSRLVSENMALKRYRDVRQLRRVATRIFIMTGTVGTLLMVLFAYPYTSFVGSPNSLASIFCIAPCIFLCCIMSSYRGYYEGMRNMIPTATSRVIESFGKMIFGVVSAWFTVDILTKEFAAHGTVMGQQIQTQLNSVGEAVPAEAVALDIIYSWGAAASVLAVTLGTIAALLYLVIYHKRVGDGFTRLELESAPKPASSISLAKLLISVAVPMVLTSLINNLSNFVDAITLQNRLVYACTNGTNIVLQMFDGMISQNTIALGPKSIANTLWGEYNTMLDFKNIIPTITQSLGISALPALAAVWTLRDRKKIRSTVDSVLRITMLISLPAGFGMAVLSQPILNLFYRSDTTGIMAPMLTVYGFGIFLIALSAPVTNMLQAVGRTDVPIKSMLLGCIVKVTMNYILVGMPEINIKGAPYSTLLMYAIMMGYNLFMLCKITHYRPRIISLAVKPLFAAAVCAAGAWGTNYLLAQAISAKAATVMAIVVAMLIYVAALFLFRAITREDILMLPKGEKIAKRLEKYGIIG